MFQPALSRLISNINDRYSTIIVVSHYLLTCLHMDHFDLELQRASGYFKRHL